MAQKVHPEEPAAPLDEHSLSARAMRGFDTYCRLVAARPGQIACGVVVVSLFFSGLPFMVWGTDALTLDFSLDAFTVRGNTIADRYYAVEAAYGCWDDCWRRLRSREAPRIRWLGKINGSEPQLGSKRRLHGSTRRLYGKNNGSEVQLGSKRRLQHAGPTVVIYNAKDGDNVLTESRLQQALSLEQEVTRLLGPPHVTPLRFIFPEYPSAGLGGAALEARLMQIAEDIHDTRHQELANWPQFDKDFSACHLSSKVLSAEFSAGSTSIYEELEDLESEDMRVAFFEAWGEYFSTQRDDTINSNMMLLIGAVLGVLVVMGIMTTSAFLAFTGLLAIVLSTGLTVFFYRIFVSEWLGVLNMFAFFLLLGIACDDVFVLVDTWEQAHKFRGIAADDYAGRLRHTLPRAGNSIFITSLTTAVAFFGNAISVIPPMRLFGVFSGIMVLLDFILTMCFLPSMLVLQHRFFGGLGCGGPCKARNAEEPSNGEVKPRTSAMDKLLLRCAPKLFWCAPVIVLVACVILGVALNVALELPPGEEFHDSELFPSWHNQVRAYEAQQSMVNLNPGIVQVDIVYGLKAVDTGDANNPASGSDTVWDTSFNPLDPKVQQFTLDLCAALVADRKLVKRLYGCWAHRLSANAAAMGRPFPVTDPNDVLWGSDGLLEEVEPGVYKTEISAVATAEGNALIKELEEHYARWEAFMEKWNEEAQRRGIGATGFQHSNRWVHMSTISDMMTSCIAACCISTACVAVMLSITLRNMFVVFLVVMHVIGVCLSLVATFVMEGRVLGVLESIAATLLVGLSVDYLAHVSSAYLAEPLDKPREQKALATIRHLGGAVIAGALTTLVSAIFLLAGLILFFSTMGSFIIRMILFSLAATLLSYVSALSLFGPEGGCGQIPCPQRCGAQAANVSQRPVVIEAGAATVSRPPEELDDEVKLTPASKRVRIGTCVGVWLILIVASIVCMVNHLTKPDGGTICPDVTELDFVFEKNPIPNTKDSYRCRGFDNIPKGCIYYVTEVEPIIGSGMVHHVLLFEVQTQPSLCPFTCFDMPDAVGMQATWAIGGNNLKWPAGTAQAIGAAPLALQMHYYNPLLEENTVDPRSGLRLKVSQQPPERLLVNLVVGLHPEGSLTIPPMQPNITFQAQCAPSLIGNVTVIAYATHAHKLGRSIMTEVLRKPTDPPWAEPITVGDVGNSPVYLFDFQRYEQFPLGSERTLSPGDEVRVSCTFDSTSRSEPTYAGWSSDTEMCMTFLIVYPGTNVFDSNCLTDYAWSES